MSTLENKLTRYLKTGNYRTIEITDHTNGFRVSFFDNFRSITFDVADSVEKAVDGCIKSFPIAQANHRVQQLKSTEAEIRDLESKLTTAKATRKRLKAQTKG